jgi:hypothetical protein
MATQYAFGKIITDGLVLCLDAADRNSYVSGSTTWNSVAGNNLSGSLINGPTFDNNNGGAIIFDGTNDYMDTSYNIEAATSSSLQTFCGWLYGYNSFFGSGASAPGQFHLILDFISSDQLRFGESNYGGGGGVLDQTNIVTVSANSTWNYACIVKTAASTFDVYFNGTKVIAGATKAATLPAPFNLGRWWNGRFVSSRIALAQIYNRALSASEVLQNYNAQKSRFGL